MSRRLFMIGVALLLGACTIEPFLNRTALRRRPHLPGGLLRFHERLYVADLHADPLMWNRDLRRRGRFGHVDLPRLREGGVDLVVFSTVSQIPWWINMERNAATDMLFLNEILMAWPPRTWFSPFERVRYQAARLADLTGPDGLLWVRWREDLAVTGHGRPAAVLGTEGAQALEGRLENLDHLYALGLRVLGLAHFFDNAVAGSAHGEQKYGLTSLGRQVVARAEALGIVLDLAHASAATIADVLALARRPVIVSHTGLASRCPGPRNLTDEQVRRIAEHGGLVGIALFAPALCAATLQEAARTIRAAVALAGPEHVALGTDFDGAVRTPIDAAGLPLLTQALADVGLDPSEIALVMGGNVRRLFAELLPRRPALRSEARP